MRMPFFSVIIPALNEEDYIPRLLDDLSQQSADCYEAIVVDGGSTDQTVSRAKAFGKKMPLTVLATDIRNVGAQRNLGAQKARGHYLIFFDADVQIPKEFLKELKEEIQRHGGDFFTTYVRADTDDVYDETIATFVNVGLEISTLVGKQFAAGHNVMISREAFAKIGGFREDIKHAEDFDFSQRLAKVGYNLVIFKSPKAVFSLRRYRQEGRLKVIRKHARAGLHTLTRGPITDNIFTYQMGGGWYKPKKGKLPSLGLAKAERYMKRLAKLFLFLE